MPLIVCYKDIQTDRDHQVLSGWPLLTHKTAAACPLNKVWPLVIKQQDVAPRPSHPLASPTPLSPACLCCHSRRCLAPHQLLLLMFWCMTAAAEAAAAQPPADHKPLQPGTATAKAGSALGYTRIFQSKHDFSRAAPCATILQNFPKQPQKQL